MWDLCAPHQPRFYIDSRRVRDLKIADGAILLTLEPERGGQLLLHILDLAQGECVQVRRGGGGGGGGGALKRMPSSVRATTCDSARSCSAFLATHTCVWGRQPSSVPAPLLRVAILLQALCRGCSSQEVRLEQQGGEGWELVELFGSHLLTKPAGGPLRITDVVSGAFR